MDGNEIEFVMIDSEALGIRVQVRVQGLSINQIRQLKKFYQSKTGDMDLESLEFNTKQF